MTTDPTDVPSIDLDQAREAAIARAVDLLPAGGMGGITAEDLRRSNTVGLDQIRRAFLRGDPSDGTSPKARAALQALGEVWSLLPR